jgi:hypothetical protein
LCSEICPTSSLDAVGLLILKLRKCDIFPPSSGSKRRPYKKPARNWYKQRWTSVCQVFAGFLYGFIINPEDGGDIFL